MKTLLVGNFGAKNLGDELILLAALQDYPGSVVMTANSAWTQSFCECEFETVGFPPTAFRSWFRYATSAAYRRQVKSLKNKFDRIIFVGGGLFAIKLRACVLWWLVFKWLKFLNPKAEFRFEYQGVDKGLSLMAKKLVKSVFEQADFVSVRDEVSAQALSDLGVKAEIKTDRFWASPLFVRALGTGKKVLVNARAIIDESLVTRLRAFDDLVFVAFEQSDLAAVPATWPGTVEFPQTVSELKRLIEMGDCLIGERLHSLLFASKILGPSKVKLLRPPYAEKVQSFTDELGWEVF